MSLLRALFDEMRRLQDWRDAVVAMDMVAAAELASVSQMREFLAEHRGWRRARQVARALEYASERSRSPAESRLRLVWEIDAQLPRPLVNEPVFSLDGKLLGIADLFDPVAGMVTEYDGREHRSVKRHARDVSREDVFRRHGLEYAKVTSVDMQRTGSLVDRLQETRRRARFAPPAARKWTLERPDDWGIEESLDDYFAMRDWVLAQLEAEREA